MNYRAKLLLPLLTIVLLAGCAGRARIAEIKDQPGRYADKNVSVTGVVTSSWGVSLLPYQIYNVDDGTGEIAVLARSGRSAPTKGARVQVKGRVNQIAAFGGRSVGLHIEERDRDYKD
jgi:hypothetical protein